MHDVKKRIIAALISVLTALALLVSCTGAEEPAPTGVPRETEAIAETPTAEPTAEPTAAVREAVYELDISYPSRGASVPATVCVPGSAEPAPLAVFLHGFGGSRGGRYSGFGRLAKALFDAGVASIRIDFAGCGESSEPFSNCSPASMEEDAANAVEFMRESYGIDPDRVLIVGHSLGGRVALELVADGVLDPAAMLLFAPAARSEILIGIFGGRPVWDALKEYARVHDEAEAWMIGKSVGYEFFEGVDRFEDPTPAAAERFHGSAAVVYAVNDNIVPPEASAQVAEILGCRALRLERGGHAAGLDLADTDPAFMEIVRMMIGMIVR